MTFSKYEIETQNLTEKPMKNLLPPNSHSKARHFARYLAAGCLILAGLTLAVTALKATSPSPHVPIIGWVTDQLVTVAGQGYATQYLQVIHDGSGVASVDSSTNPSFYATTDLSFVRCTAADVTAGCADTITGYKVTFNKIPTSDTAASIRLAVTENGLTAYTAFTLRRNVAGIANAPNPPTIQSLPNRVVLVSSVKTVTYTTQFVVGDLDSGGTEDVCVKNPDGTYDCSQTSLLFSATSDNHMLLADSPSGIQLTLMPPSQDPILAAVEAPRHYTLTATPIGNRTGKATVSVKVTDPDGNATTTAFVLVVAASGNSPSISNPFLDNFEEQTSLTPGSNTLHNFTVADLDGNLDSLRVNAFSSNTLLIPNDFINNLIVTPPGVNGAGHVQIIPNLAALLPLSPGPGKLPQAATITLSVSDQVYTRQVSFLYVVRDPSCPAVLFNRPNGVYPTNKLDLPGNYPFINGSMYNLQWDQVEATMGNFVFSDLGSYLDALPLGQDRSIDLHKEPCYIATTPGVVTWCDSDGTNNPSSCTVTFCDIVNKIFKRPVPWDSYLLGRWKALIGAMSSQLTAAEIGKISTININLPGGGTGIRNLTADYNPDCVSGDITCLPGYSRANLLLAIERDLEVVQDKFPGKPIQIGFFPVTDCHDSCIPGYGDACNMQCPENKVWQWLYKDATADTDPSAVDENSVHVVALSDEFNGIKRPRVHFFQEDLSAARASIPNVSRSNAPNYITPKTTTAYSILPVTSFVPAFAYYNGLLTNQAYNNGNTWQANTIWGNPFLDSQGQKLLKNINGSPNDGMEGAFNTFLSQYLEVYQDDMDEALPPVGVTLPLNAELWAGQLESWREYAAHLRGLAPLEAPAGLTVERASATSNVVKWNAVYGATSYAVQSRALGGSPSSWLDVVGCSATSNTMCTDSSTTGTAYAYQVRANGAVSTPWTSVAVFLSEGTTAANYDGYVQLNGSTKTAYNSATEPGIRAGTASQTAIVSKGFLSFDTSALAGATVLAARLRMYETTDTAFDSTHPCHIDVKTGAFHDNLTLEPDDFDPVTAPATDTDVAQMQPLDDPLNSGPLHWYQAEINPAHLADINNSTNQFGHTQFRLYFSGLQASKMARWNAGDTYPSGVDKPPQLIVQYQP